MDQKYSISVILPAYNEEETVFRVLKRLEAVQKTLYIEIVFVDDGSNDRTFDIIKELSHIKVVHHCKNYGKGAAIRSGLKHSTGDILIIQDADLEYPPENIFKIVDPIVKKQADAVYGSRFLSSNMRMKVVHFLGNKILSAAASILYRTKLSDIMTGHKAFRKEVLHSLTLTRNGFEIEAEITAKLLLSGFKLLEVPVSYYPRKIGKSKINLKHGLTSLITLIIEKFK